MSGSLFFLLFLLFCLGAFALMAYQRLVWMIVVARVVKREIRFLRSRHIRYTVEYEWNGQRMEANGSSRDIYLEDASVVVMVNPRTPSKATLLYSGELISPWMNWMDPILFSIAIGFLLFLVFITLSS